jgi:hypothetical protein
LPEAFLTFFSAYMISKPLMVAYALFIVLNPSVGRTSRLCVSPSLNRADMRRQAVVKEANAIGTAILGVNPGAELGRTELRRGVRDYAHTQLI